MKSDRRTGCTRYIAFARHEIAEEYGIKCRLEMKICMTCLRAKKEQRLSESYESNLQYVGL